MSIEIKSQQGYHGELHRNAVDLGSIRNDSFYLVDANHTIKPIRGRNLRDFLGTFEGKKIEGEVRGFFEEGKFKLQIVECIRQRFGKDAYIDELPSGTYNLRFDYEDNVSTVHRGMNMNELILRLSLREEDAEAFVQVTGEN